MNSIWWEANENSLGSHTQVIIYLSYPLFLLSLSSTQLNLSKISSGCLMIWWQLQELSPSGFDTKSRKLPLKYETVFTQHRRRGGRLSREDAPDLQCYSYFSCFQVKITGFPAWIFSVEQQSSSETAAVMNFYSFINREIQTLYGNGE